MTGNAWTPSASSLDKVFHQAAASVMLINGVYINYIHTRL